MFSLHLEASSQSIPQTDFGNPFAAPMPPFSSSSGISMRPKVPNVCWKLVARSGPPSTAVMFRRDDKWWNEMWSLSCYDEKSRLIILTSRTTRLNKTKARINEICHFPRRSKITAANSPDCGTLYLQCQKQHWWSLNRKILHQHMLLILSYSSNHPSYTFGHFPSSRTFLWKNLETQSCLRHVLYG